ncbi:hypothetical protein U1Q18_043752 [Sarracenia purpurea var. burkii]
MSQWSEFSVPSMPLSMVPPTVHFHMPVNVPANIPAASSSAANVSSPHVNVSNNTPIDLHVDIPTCDSLNSETIVST